MATPEPQLAPGIWLQGRLRADLQQTTHATTNASCFEHTKVSVMGCTAGESMGIYVPQAVLSKDGTVLDVDLVLSEAASDGDELVVEYSEGPLAFRTRSALTSTTDLATLCEGLHDTAVACLCYYNSQQW